MLDRHLLDRPPFRNRARLASSTVRYGRRLDCDSEAGRLICDQVVEAGDMEAAVEGVAENFLYSGVVGAAANRRAFRIGQEPLDLFRRSVAFTAKAQAHCHFSPQLIDNLERFWQAAERKGWRWQGKLASPAARTRAHCPSSLHRLD